MVQHNVDVKEEDSSSEQDEESSLSSSSEEEESNAMEGTRNTHWRSRKS